MRPTSHHARRLPIAPKNKQHQAPNSDDGAIIRIRRYLSRSPPIVVIDNVDGALGSAPLAMALTAGQVSDRQLEAEIRAANALVAKLIGTLAIVNGVR